MGVLQFFNSLEKIKCIKKNGIHIGFKNKIITDYFYDDFNSTIYTIVSNIEKELNYLLYAIILNQQNQNIFQDEKSLEISNLWKFNFDKSVSIQDYKNYFTSDLIDKIAIERVKNSLIDKITNLIDPMCLKLLMISIDGVPEFSKKGEQKKRRYNGVVINELKKKIYKKYELAGKINQSRILYENNKISYDRGKIISWTSFMDAIEKLLVSDSLLSDVQSVCPNLKKIIVSHQNVYGEGEKKIMEHIIENKLQGNYTFFSPDADAIMLGIIAQNKLHNGSIITILRYNQQSEEYDVVNIDVISNNIFNYVANKIGSDNNTLMTKESVTNDIAFIFTLFGNDFIPRVDSIDVRNDLERIMDIYCEVMKKTQKKYLIFQQSGSDKYRINYWNFAEFIKYVSIYEPSMLNETYLANKHSNYSYLKKELSVNILMPTVKQYILIANELFSHLRTRAISRLNNDDFSFVNEIGSLYTNNEIFMEQFLIFEDVKFKRDDTGKIPNLSEKFMSQLYKIVKYFLIGNGKIKGQIRGNIIFKTHKFATLGKNSIANIIKSFPHNLMEITEYDTECYMLEHKMGIYELKLNANDFELGAVKISYDIDGNYVIKHYYKHETVTNYYETFFNMKHEIKDCCTKEGKFKKIIVFDEKSLVTLVEDYLKGLFWVFDTYFNKNNSEENSKFVSTWSYPYHRSPLMYQVKDVLWKFASNGQETFINKMNGLYLSVTTSKEFIVPRENYMNKLEHYLYVTPYSKHHEIPEKYVNFIESNRDIYPDLSELANLIWENDDNSHLIDCRRISYVNKCNLLTINSVSFNEFMNRIGKLRDGVNLSQNTNNFIKEFNVENNTDKTKNKIPFFVNKDGNITQKNKITKYVTKFKNLYKMSKDLKYKLCYKSLKKIITNPDNNTDMTVG